jgi:aerobic C4-dicarboxylate transport protein
MPAKVVPTAAPARRRSLLGPLWLQVLVAIVLGVLAGVFFPHQAVSLKPLGDGFVRLIRMTLAPIIFASVVIGIAKMGDLKEVGRVGALRSSPPFRCLWA